jgi:hypothetical protein
MRRFSIIALLVVLTATFAAPTSGENPAEVEAEVPALFAFHGVIFPLWHDAWPNKDVEQMLELLPQAEEHVKALSEAELPGILRDKQQSWDEGLASLKSDLAQYRAAAESDNTDELLDAVESLHAHFEEMVRLVRPPMKELHAYHQVLYFLYHHIVPEDRAEELAPAAEQLADRCAGLKGAPAPRRFSGDEGELRACFASLCEATDAFAAAARDGDAAAVKAALEVVHTNYQKAERLLN